MSNIVLVTRPSSDKTTRYISAWAEHTIEQLKSKEVQFIELAKERAVSSVFDSMLKKHKPALFFLNGHGSADCVCGHNDEVLLEAGRNESLLKNAITYALSCSSAKNLGVKAVEKGASAYIGYNEDFVFFISPEKMSRPREDKTAEMFLAPANHVVVSLVKGHTAGKAVENAKGYFIKSIQKLVSSESAIDDREYIRYLIWDMKSLVCHGNKEAVL